MNLRSVHLDGMSSGGRSTSKQLQVLPLVHAPLCLSLGYRIARDAVKMPRPSLPHESAHLSLHPCAAAMLKARHAAERLQGAWHGGLSSIDQLRGRMQDCLAEFAVSRDEAEVLAPAHVYLDCTVSAALVACALW